MTAYQALRQPRHETLRVRGLDMHLTRWGPEISPLQPPLFLLHGWLDAGATFQFVVDAFKKEWPIVAPDWRGFGRSEWPQEGYGFPDYLGDFDALMDLISPFTPARIVGHSMGGNIACLFAGLRPERVRCVVSLEGVGLPRTSAHQAPQRMRKWLDQIKTQAIEKNYNSFEQLTAIIQFRYPRFSPAIAEFVARAWGVPDENDRVRLAADPRHHWVNPILYESEKTPSNLARNSRAVDDDDRRRDRTIWRAWARTVRCRPCARRIRAPKLPASPTRKVTCCIWNSRPRSRRPAGVLSWMRIE